MTSQKSKMSDGRASRAGDDQPDLKWVVEWLVEREGQRRTAALLGVNRKTVALALQRERLTGRMTLAVQRLMVNLDDLAGQVERLTRRVEALEAAQTPKDAAGDHTSDEPDAEGRGLRLFSWRRRRQALSEEESDG